MPISLIIDLNFSVLMWKQFPPSPPLSLALKSWYLKHNWTHFFSAFMKIVGDTDQGVMMVTGKMAK